jgi:RimJ/RimL family protein N-acetyltransferase
MAESKDSAACAAGGPAVLETARLRLRKLVAADLDWLCELDSDPEVMRFISGGEPTPRDTMRDVYLPRMLQVYPLGPQYGFYAAEWRRVPGWLGWFHLRPERIEPGDMELGYRLRREVWGLGLATEGSRELLGRALREWSLPRVAARTLEVNLASRRVMEKCGMRWERDFVYPAEWLPGWPEERRRAVRYVKLPD